MTAGPGRSRPEPALESRRCGLLEHRGRGLSHHRRRHHRRHRHRCRSFRRRPTRCPATSPGRLTSPNPAMSRCRSGTSRSTRSPSGSSCRPVVPCQPEGALCRLAEEPAPCPPEAADCHASDAQTNSSPLVSGSSQPPLDRVIRPAAVAELVDAQASGACALRGVEVRVLSAASHCR